MGAQKRPLQTLIVSTRLWADGLSGNNEEAPGRTFVVAPHPQVLSFLRFLCPEWKRCRGAATAGGFRHLEDGRPYNGQRRLVADG